MSICQIYDLCAETLWLGRYGENGARDIAIDVGKWFADFGAEGTVVLVNWRPGEDDTPYNPNITMDGSKVVWSPSNIDLAISGRGFAELRYYVGNTLAKSKTFRTVIDRTPSEGANPPSAAEDWVERMEDAAVTAQTASETAVTAAETATEGAQAVAQALPTVTQAAATATTAAATATNAATEAALSEEVASAAANAAQTASETATAASQTAVSSASTATTKAAEAVEAASTATTKASEAAQAATTATANAQTSTTKAEEATTAAATATSKATEATTAASTASAAATTASSAASTATSEASTATAAKTAAQTAQTAAETAQGAAESAAASVSASAAQIATNTSDISAIKTDLSQLGTEIRVIAARDDSWSAIRENVKMGFGELLYPVGTEFEVTCPSGAPYNSIIFVVVDHRVENSEHIMTMLMKHVIYGTEFDAIQAIICPEETMAAGTYHFALLSGYDTTYDGGKNVQFTLANDLEAGGQIVMNWPYNQTWIGKNLTVYHAFETSAVETCIMSEGTGGTDLGAADGTVSILNHTQRARYGSNNYKESAIREWFDSDDAANAWQTQQTRFQRPCSYRTRAGFVTYLDPEFVAVIREGSHPNRTNEIFDLNGKKQAYSTTGKFFLASQEEIGFSSESGIVCGSVFDYYNGASQADKIKYDITAQTTARYWWLRTPNPYYAIDERTVFSSGALISNSAYYGLGAAAACEI